MALPIVLYGNPVLRKQCSEVIQNKLPNDLIEKMWETLTETEGVGLAAPQIGHGIKLFIVNTKIYFDDITGTIHQDLFQDDTGIVEVFINPKIRSITSRTWDNKEGCLSIPGISEYVNRPWEITTEYYDANFQKQTKEFSGYTARVIQHEYDHTCGILYIDHLSALKKRLLKKKLNNIINRRISTDYKVKYS